MWAVGFTLFFHLTVGGGNAPTNRNVPTGRDKEECYKKCHNQNEREYPACTHHTDTIEKAARQELFFLSRLRRLNMDSRTTGGYSATSKGAPWRVPRSAASPTAWLHLPSTRLRNSFIPQAMSLYQCIILNFLFHFLFVRDFYTS